MGSSSPSGESKYTWNDVMAPKWGNTLNNAEALSWQGFSPYEGQPVAGRTATQQQAKDYAWNMATMSSSPIGAMDSARGQIEKTLGGQYLTSDPYAMNANPYEGENPYFSQALANTMSKTTNHYKNATAPELTRLMNMSGAFGGSAHQTALANNETALADSLSNIANTARSEQYDRSAGLRENYLNRGSQGYQSERDRQMGAVGQGQNEQGLAYQRINELMGQGNLDRDINQKNLDFQLSQFQDAKNWPYKQFDFLTNLYGRAQGGLAPNQTMYSGGNGMAQGAGGLLALASLFGGQ